MRWGRGGSAWHFFLEHGGGGETRLSPYQSVPWYGQAPSLWELSGGLESKDPLIACKREEEKHLSLLPHSHGDSAPAWTSEGSSLEPRKQRSFFDRPQSQHPPLPLPTLGAARRMYLADINRMSDGAFGSRLEKL